MLRLAFYFFNQDIGMLTNFELDILLNISDHLSFEESQGLYNLLSDALSDKESKKLLQELQEAVGK